MKDISIVVVTFNSSKLIKNLMDSLCQNLAQIKEVLVIENNSPDRNLTKKICEQYKKYLNLKFYLSEKNFGFAKSCNRGARKSTGKYILFLNPDAKLRKNSLKIFLSHMKSEKADIIGGKLVGENDKFQESAVRAPNLKVALLEFSNIGKILKNKSGHKYFYYADQNLSTTTFDKPVIAVSGACLLISRKAFEILDGFDENMFMYLEDVDLGKRANDNSLKVVFCPHSIITHIGGASSNNKYRIVHQAWFDSRKYYYKKHSGLLENLLIQPIFTIEEFLLKKLKEI